MRVRARALVVASLLSLVGCNATKNPITPKGTELFALSQSKATRAEFVKATVGAKTSKDFVVNVHPDGTVPFTVDVHVVFASVDLVEGGKTTHHTAPIEMRATVGDNTGWDLGGSCEEGPSYQMGPLDDAGVMISPEPLIQDCVVRHHRIEGTVFESSWQLGFHLQAYGDGKLEPFPDDGIEIKAK